MLDTTREAAERQAEIHREMGGSERVRIAFEMSLLARELGKARIRAVHPEYTDTKVVRAWLHAMYPELQLPRRAE